MTRSPDSLVRIGVIANILVAGLLSIAYAVSHPLFGTPDEMGHLDYAYSLWRGRFPAFEDGLTLDPGFGFRPPTQWTAQHPPLFYLIEAPAVGPLLDAHRYTAAGYAGRAVNVLFACALAAAMMWTARVIATRHTAFWLAAGTLAAVHPAVVFMGGVIYNDEMFVTFCILTIGITARIVIDGLTWRRVAMFALLATALVLTRSAGIAVFGLCGLALAASLLFVRPWPWRRLAGLTGTGLVVIAASGWFYLRNLRLTGNLLGTQLDDDLFYLKNRVERPFSEVMIDPETWRQWHLVWGHDVVNSSIVAVLAVGVPMAVSAVLASRRLIRAPAQGEIILVVFTVALIVTVVVMQGQYVAMRGGASWRYLMPLMPITTLAAAWALTANRQLMPLLFPAWLLLAVVPLAAACGRILVTGDPESTAATFPGATGAALLAGGMALGVAVFAVLWSERTSPPTRTSGASS